MLTIPVLCAMVTASGLHWEAPAPEPALGGETRIWTGEDSWKILELRQNDAVQQGEQDDSIEKLRKDLLTEGVEARLGRERAVGGLLLSKEPRAHAILQEALQRPEDPDRLKPFILDQLESKWAQTQDPVFGDESDLRMQLIKSYAAVIVRMIQVDNRGQRSSEQRAIEAEILACLRDSIRPDERMQVFSFLLDDASSDAMRRRAAMFAAAGCRDVSLIPLIAGFLDDPDLRNAAQAALQEKLITAEAFSDRRQFDAWWEQNRNKTNIELTEQSARESVKQVLQVRAEVARELEEARLRVLRYAARQEDWPELLSRLQGAEDEDKDIPGPYLAELREALRQRSGPPGGDPAQRASLVKYLLDKLDKPDTRSRELILEDLAYLVTATDGSGYGRVQEQLRKSLHSGQPAESAAAFKGIVRFFSVENRRRVVIASNGFLKSRELTSLEAGLQCLRDRGWQAPGEGDLDLSEWVGLLEAVFADEDLGPDIKESAISLAETAGRIDGTSGVVFSLLIDRVLDDRVQPARVRRFALDNLSNFFTEDRAREETYLQAVTGLLADPDVQMRKRAAEVLKGQPFVSFPVTIRKDWAVKIVMLAADRLREEPDTDVRDGLISLLLQMNEQPGEPNVVGRLRILAEDLSGEAANDSAKAPLREALSKVLIILGVESGIPLSKWVPVGQALLYLNNWTALRRVLSDQKVVDLKPNPSDEWTRNAFELVIRAALLRPSGSDWAPDEALELELAFGALEQAPGSEISSYDNSTSRLLRLSALASRQQHQQVAKIGVPYLVDSRVAFEPKQVGQARVMVAEALIALGLPDAAKEQLNEIANLGIAAPELPRLWLDVAGIYRSQEDWDSALQIVQDRFTAEGSPLYREAFLLQMECRLSKDPGQRAEIQTLLMEQGDVYTKQDMSEALQQRYQALLLRAGKTN